MLKHALAGAVGGALGGILMKRFQSAWDSTFERPEARVFGLDAETDIAAAERTWAYMFQKELSNEKAQKIGEAMHYGFAVAAGVAYGVLGSKFPAIYGGYGTAYASAVWLAGDEIAVSATGLSDPFEKRAAAHLSAFAAHLLYGAAMELGRRSVLRLFR